MKNAMQFEDLAGKPDKDFDIANAKDICNMLTVMLKRTDPEITFDKVTELVHRQNWFDVQKGIAKVMELRLLDSKGEPIDLGDDGKNPA
jgi:hypothetical protein